MAASAKMAAGAKVAAKGSAILSLSRVVRLPEAEKIVSSQVASISVTDVTALNPVRAHKFRVGQTVSYTSSPISRPGASGSYQVVRCCRRTATIISTASRIPAKPSSALPKKANSSSIVRA